MPDYDFIQNCSPTLAGLKTGSLFRCKFKNVREMYFYIYKWNSVLNSKGVYVTIMRRNNDKALLYVYRLSSLTKDLNQRDTAELLCSLGYDTHSIKNCIEQLSSRVKYGKSFPHEVGLFLGYPYQDVVGFIENKGQNSLITGCWKVYYNVREAQKVFERLKECKENLTRLYCLGSTVAQLTDAV